MANLSPSQSIQYALGQGGFDMPIDGNGIETASSTYVAGAPLQYSSGKIAGASASITTSNKVAGISIYKATGVTNAAVQMIVPTATCVFTACLQASSGGNSVDTHTLAQTDVGTTMQIAQDGVSSKWFLDFTNTSTPVAIVVGLVSAIGTKNGVVYFKFINGGTVY